MSVEKAQGKIYAEVCIDDRLSLGGGSVMVWAGIIAKAHKELVFINDDSLTSHGGARRSCYAFHGDYGGT